MNQQFGIGIDFGTTNSVVCFYDDSIKTSRAFLDKGLPHSSVIWYRADGSKPQVGRESRRQMRSYSGTEGHHFQASIKRQLGKDYEEFIFGRKVKCHEITSEIFRFLKEDALTQRPDLEFTHAVVTIPVYFDGKARRDLRKSADNAGIFIRSFIHEPFAAIVGYLSRSKSLERIDTLSDKTILVFDWGGGTLDITVAKVLGSQIIELAICGVNDRSGDFFDEEIMKFALSRSYDRNGISSDTIRIVAGDKGRILTECERTKIALSELSYDKIQIGRAYSQSERRYDVDEIINRSELNNIVANEVDDAIIQVESTLSRAGVSPHAIDQVLLIGGTSRMPYVRDRLREMFSHRITEIKNADTIIAEGAAVIDALGFQPFFARSLCVELADDSLYPVFEEGSLAVPDLCKKTLSFYCTDNRNGEAKLILKDRSNEYRSSKPALKNILTIPVSPELPRPYKHEKVSVDFWLDSDLIVNVKGKAATQRVGNSHEIYDLCYGLRLFNSDME